MTPACVLISPIRGEEKHPANPLSMKQRFLNFGALSVASFLTKHGAPTIVIDEYSLGNERNLASELSARFGQARPLLVGVSSISSYSADRVNDILQILSDLWPGVPRAIGGQHFVGFWGGEFAKRMPKADLLIAGEAESAMNDVVAFLRSGKTFDSLVPADMASNVYWQCEQRVLQGERRAEMRLPIDTLIDADYSLYPGSESLFPSIEYSRGCPFSCVFCANGRENRLGYRRASAFAVGQAVSKLIELRQERTVQFYLQASNFSVTSCEAHELHRYLADTADSAHWRTEIRVDGIEPGAMKTLAAAGLRVLDMGLESASPKILRTMRKTVNPDAYLAHAARTLQEANSQGIFTKVNFLIHPGDSRSTVAESWEWLEKHSNVISGVSSGVALEYPGTPLSRELPRFIAEYGTERIAHPLSKWGVNFLRPSSDLTLSEAERLAAQIAQSLQTRDSFAKSKSFGYLGADASTNAILADLPEASHDTPYRD